MKARWFGLFVLLLLPPIEARADEYGKYDFPNICRPITIVAQFTAANSSYKFSGTCLLNTFPYRWTAEGSYSPKDGRVKEHVLLTDDQQHRGEIRSSMACNVDPWLGPAACRDVNASSQGSLAFSVNQHPHLENLQSFVLQRTSPMTTSLSFDRRVLLAKRDADLKAEAAATKARSDKRLREATQSPVSYLGHLSPVIVTPTASQRFFSQTAVAIRLRPPQQLVDTQVGLDGRPLNSNRMYMVRLERKDAAGNWVAHTTLPVGALQAESATGYTDFGAGVPPGGLTVPGAWRLSAQLTAPQQTGWSDWIQFIVMAPVTNKAIQKAPKAFGP